MRRRDIAVAAAEFGAVPWPGKDGALFESYLQEQDRGVHGRRRGTTFGREMPGIARLSGPRCVGSTT
jgi:hypothetical protein